MVVIFRVKPSLRMSLLAKQINTALQVPKVWPWPMTNSARRARLVSKLSLRLLDSICGLILLQTGIQVPGGWGAKPFCQWASSRNRLKTLPRPDECADRSRWARFTIAWRPQSRYSTLAPVIACRGRSQHWVKLWVSLELRGGVDSACDVLSAADPHAISKMGGCAQLIAVRLNGAQPLNVCSSGLYRSHAIPQLKNR
jgi:hypothetical protein